MRFRTSSVNVYNNSHSTYIPSCMRMYLDTSWPFNIIWHRHKFCTFHSSSHMCATDIDNGINPPIIPVDIAIHCLEFLGNPLKWLCLVRTPALFFDTTALLVGFRRTIFPQRAVYRGKMLVSCLQVKSSSRSGYEKACCQLQQWQSTVRHR